MDVADWDRSTTINVPGQSGQPGSRHYGDLLPMWAKGAYHPMAFSREAVERHAASRLKLVPLPKAAFWWESAGGRRVLAYRVPSCGWYGSERDEMPRRLSAVLDLARKSDLHHVGVYFGLGNHGGGPTRRQVQDAVTRAKTDDGPVIIHAVTRKGAGYVHAEVKPDAFHGIGPFERETGRVNGSKGPISFTEAFSQALIREAEADERIVAVTAAMPSGTGLDRFAGRRRHR